MNSSSSFAAEAHVVRLTMSWHYATVAVSYLVAVLAAYSTVNVLQHPVSHVVSILAAFGFAVGGVWSMHFIGMEAMLLGIDVEFEPGLTVASAAAAFVCVAVALVLCKWQVARSNSGSEHSAVPAIDSEEEEEEADIAALEMRESTVCSSDNESSQQTSRSLQYRNQTTERSTARTARAKRTRRERITKVAVGFLKEHWTAFKHAPHVTLNIAAWFVALGVCAMHYLGIEAMSTIATVEYNVPVIAASVLIAIFAATAALYMALILPITKRYVVPTALVMGVAVCGMHYTGMYGVTYDVDLNSAAYAAARRHKSVERPWGFWVLALSSAYSFCLLALNSYLYQQSLGMTLRKSRAALRASKAVAALLAAYDTDAVETTLDRYEWSDTADSAIATVYRSLLANLNTYRPFLPQYLFHADEKEDGHDDLFDGASQHMSEQRRRRARSQATTDSFLVSSITSDSLQRNEKERARSIISVTSADPNAVLRARFPSSLQYFSGTVSYCRLVLSHHCVSSARRPHPTKTKGTGPGKTGELVKVISAESYSEQNHWAERLVSAQQHAVLAVNRIGRLTSSSVHSVTGDAVVCSWNATRRVHQPAAKMATFILRLQSALRDPIPSVAAAPTRPTVDPVLSLRGVAFTGPAECLLAGDKTGRMPVVSGYWTESELKSDEHAGSMTVEDLMMQESRLLGCVVVDAATAVGAETVAETRLVDAVGTCRSHDTSHDTSLPLLDDDNTRNRSPPGPSAISPDSCGTTAPPRTAQKSKDAGLSHHEVHVLLAGFDQEAEDEWMYVLEEQDKRTKDAASCKLRSAVAAALIGDFDTAVEHVACVRAEQRSAESAAERSPSAQDVSMQTVMKQAAAVLESKLRFCKANGLLGSEFAGVTVLDSAVVRRVTTL